MGFIEYIKETKEIFLAMIAFGTILGFIIKAFNGFFIEYIKTKYKIIQFKQSPFEVILTIVGVIVLLSEFIILGLYIYDSFKNKSNSLIFKSLTNLKISSDLIDSLSLIIALLILFMMLSLIIILKIKEVFIRKLEYGNYFKVKKTYKVINILSISVACILIIFSIIGLFAQPNKEAFTFIIFLLSISLIICLVQISVRGVIKEIEFIDGYIMHFGEEVIHCSCFLEYDDFYLIFANQSKKYIKKSEIKEIKKGDGVITNNSKINENGVKNNMINEKRNNSEYVKSIIVIAIVSSIIILPILIDKVIIKNKVFSYISNEAWVSFLGSYIGAIISGVVSLGGILYTINYYKSQYKKEELNANFPVLQCRLYEFTSIVENEGTKIVWGDSEEYTKEIVHYIEIINVMDNVALNLRVEDIISNNIKLNLNIDWDYIVLQKNQQVKINIHFRIKDETELRISELKFKLKYSDKKNNWYEREFRLDITRGNCMTIEGELTHPIQAALRIGEPKHIQYENKPGSIVFPIYK